MLFGRQAKTFGKLNDIFMEPRGTLGAGVDSGKNGTKTNFRNGKGRWSPPLTEIGSAHEFSNETPCENEPLVFE